MPELPERLLPPLRREPGQTDRLGGSSYRKLYDWVWFYNGYHAEPHFRPKVHWTKMEAFHKQIAELQRQEGVRVIKPPHAFGFLDPDLPPRSQTAAPSTQAAM